MSLSWSSAGVSKKTFDKENFIFVQKSPWIDHFSISCWMIFHIVRDTLPLYTGLWSIGRWYFSAKYGKCSMFNNPHDRHESVSNIFCPYLRDWLLQFWEINQKFSNSVNFLARIMFFLCKWVKISTDIAKLSSSSVPVQSNLNWDLALNLVITTHPHPGK